MEKTPAETFTRPYSKLRVLISQAFLLEHRNLTRVYFTSIIFPTEKECSLACTLQMEYILGKKKTRKKDEF